MRAFVFTDESLGRQAGRFVWLAIDTENPVNAGFEDKLAVEALPSFFLVDPVDDTVMKRWVGSATVAQLHQFLDEGRLAWATRHPEGPAEARAVASPPPGAPAVDPAKAEAALARADEAYGKGDNAEAVKLYEEALAAAPAVWPSYPRCVEALLFALGQEKQYARCVELAGQAHRRLKGTVSAANVAASGLDCAVSLDEKAPERAPATAAFEMLVREALSDATSPLAADDRSGLYNALLGVRQDVKDEAGAKRIASQWLAFLEGEMARARTPEQRTVFDSHLLSAAIALGEPQRAIPALEASERDLPEDFNPPARLALAYKEMKRWDEALSAVDRALKRVYGPRTVRVYQTKADILVAKGDVPAARKVLGEAVAFVEKLPAGKRRESLREALRKRVDSLPS